MKVSRRRAGFTLLELMIVLVIISVLASAFLLVAGKVFGQAAERKCLSRLQQLAVMIEAYHSIEGEYPDDRLPTGAATNQSNAGSEALYLAFFDPAFTGESPNLEWLVNTDGDQTSRTLTRMPSRDLFEIGDPWGNPIAYFESLHYADRDSRPYFAGLEGEDPEEQVAEPRRNGRTGGFDQPGKFQLVSAGADGLFGTEDDLAHYD